MKSTLFSSVRLFASQPYGTTDYVRLSRVFVTNDKFWFGILAFSGAAVVANEWLTSKEFETIKADIGALKVDMRKLKADMGAIKADLATLLSSLPPK